MKNILLIILLVIAAVMIYLGLKADMLPPTLTGLGFIVIVALFFTSKK
jgi:hypothetical protein